MRIATTTADLAGYGQSMADRVRAIAGTGFTHVDLSFYRALREGGTMTREDWMDEVRAAKDAAEACGLDFVQAHAPGSVNPFAGQEEEDRVVEADRKCLLACRFLGIPAIVVHAGHTPHLRYPDDMEPYRARSVAFYSRLIPFMEETGVRVLVENSSQAIMGGRCFFMRGREVREVLDELDHPLFAACWDTGHANLECPDMYSDIMAIGDRLGAIHFQDNFGKCDDHIAPLMGTLDIDCVMRGLIDSGFVARGGVLTFEAENMLLFSGGRPNRRNESQAEKRLSSPSLSLRRESLALLHAIGREVLDAYGIDEEESRGRFF